MGVRDNWIFLIRVLPYRYKLNEHFKTRYSYKFFWFFWVPNYPQSSKSSRAIRESSAIQCKSLNKQKCSKAGAMKHARKQQKYSTRTATICRRQTVPSSSLRLPNHGPHSLWAGPRGYQIDIGIPSHRTLVRIRNHPPPFSATPRHPLSVKPGFPF